MASLANSHPIPYPQKYTRRSAPPRPRTHAHLDTAPLILTERPSDAHWQAWWQAFQADPMRVAFADTSPTTLPAFRRAVDQGSIWFLACTVDHDLVACWWLHDLICDWRSAVCGGWVGVYVCPRYRGPMALLTWVAVQRWWRGAGVEHFFSAVRVEHVRAQRFAVVCQFSRISLFRDFARFKNQARDCVIYTYDNQDRLLAWTLAQQRHTARVQP